MFSLEVTNIASGVSTTTTLSRPTAANKRPSEKTIELETSSERTSPLITLF